MPESLPIIKRVLMTTDTLGGVWTYSIELAHALAGLGIEVALAAMGPALDADRRSEFSSLRSIEVFERNYRLEWMDDPWQDVYEAAEWLLQIENAIRPDIVHLNGYAHGNLSWKTPTLVVGHSCVLSWWLATKGENAPPEWDTYRRKVGEGISAADLVIAPSQAMLDSLRKFYGPIENAAVIPNGRDPGLFRPGVKKEFILAVGRLWDEGKNLAALDCVAPRLKWPVFVAGEGRNPGGGFTRHPHVKSLGYLPPKALSGWFSHAAVYALPARYEPFGLSALEAALSGCALVLGDIPSLREIWDGAALFIDPGDHDQLAAAIDSLIFDKQKRAELAGSARDRALEFSPKRMSSGYISAYRELSRCRKLPALKRG